MSVMSNNIQLEKKSIFTTKLLLSITSCVVPRAFHHCFSSIQKENCTSYIYSPNVYGDTSNCLKQTWKTDLAWMKRWKWHITNVKNVYQSWLVHSERLHKDLCSFNTGSLPRNQQGLVLKIATEGGMKDGSLVVPARTCLTMFGQVQKVGEINISALCRLSNPFRFVCK